MGLAHRDRFKLRSQLVEELSSERWTFDRTNLLFAEFGAEQLSTNWDGPSAADVVGTLDDTTLTEMYAIVFEVDVDEIEGVVESAGGESRWKPGYARIFLSHVAVQRVFAAEVSAELAVAGIDGFVAHDAMEVSKPWQEQIAMALSSMDALVALVHPGFNDSAWCQEEVGWAFGRRVPTFAVRLGSDPSGFLSRDQWPSHVDSPVADVAGAISAWAVRQGELGDSIVDGLVGELESARSYVAAGAAAERLAALGHLTHEQFHRLDRIWLANDQVYGGVLATKALKPLYLQNGRDWPPTKTDR